MSESSGGQALKEASVSENQIEVRLLFESRDYTLSQLTTRLQDIEALMELLLRSKLILNPGRSLSRNRQRQIRELVRKGVARSSRQRELGVFAAHESLRGFRVSHYLRGAVLDFRAIATASRVTVRVETVSLSSPFEIFLLVTGPVAVLASVVKLLLKFIQVKNDWNESRVVRAASNLKIDRLKLEQEVVKLVAAEVEKIDMDTYFSLPEKHPSKTVVKRSIQALSALDKAEVRK